MKWLLIMLMTSGAWAECVDSTTGLPCQEQVKRFIAAKNQLRVDEIKKVMTKAESAAKYEELGALETSSMRKAQYYQWAGNLRNWAGQKNKALADWKLALKFVKKFEKKQHATKEHRELVAGVRASLKLQGVK